MKEVKSLAPLMTVKEVAEYLRVHPATVYRLLRDEGLPGFRIGADWRFNSEQIDHWCLKHSENEQQGTDTRASNDSDEKR
jgi:excisionase family DNA binding protein